MCRETAFSYVRHSNADLAIGRKGPSSYDYMRKESATLCALGEKLCATLVGSVPRDTHETGLTQNSGDRRPLLTY